MFSNLPIIGRIRGRPVHAIAGGDGSRPFHEVRADLARAEEHVRALRDQADQLVAAHPDDFESEPVQARAQAIQAQHTAARASAEALREEARTAMVEGYRRGAFQTEYEGQPALDADGRPMPPRGGRAAQPTGPGWEQRSAGLRAIEASGLAGAAADRLDSLVRDERNDPGALAGRYLAAIADPAYRSAFVRALAEGPTAVLGMSPAEQVAMREVRTVTSLRAMAVGSGPAGGFAVPFQLDPTIVLSGDGAIHPYRDLATVHAMASNELRLVTSEGATVGYGAEASPTSDGSPVLAQPILHAERGTGFVPFSIEVGMDWRGIEQALGNVLADARNVLDAAMFTSGAGHASQEPQGILTGLGPEQRVSDGAITPLEVYDLVSALPARFSPRAVFVSNLATLLHIRSLVAAADDEHQPLVNDAMDRILGRPWREASEFPTGALLYGSMRDGFAIGDRVGMLVEVIPHTFEAATGLPKGERGLFALWRSTSLVTVPNALRVHLPGSG